MHYLMKYSHQLYYLVCIIPFIRDDSFSKEDSKKGLRYVLTVITIMFLFVNIRYANNLYYYKKLVGDGTLSAVTKITYDMEKTDGYNPEVSRVVIIGDVNSSQLNADYYYRDEFSSMGGGTTGSSITYNEVFREYLKVILGKNVFFASEDVKSELMEENSKFVNMPVYPRDGYCKMVDDNLVIKFSEP